MSRHAVNERPEAGSRHGVRRDRPGTPAGEGVSCPEWARDAVIYAAYPRAFTPGTLEGVRRRLGHIRELGAGILWLLPIHPIGRAGRKGPLGSPYAIRDYLAVNPEYGSEADLARLVGDAHAAGLRVILDLVVNHAALDHPAAAAT